MEVSVGVAEHRSEKNWRMFCAIELPPMGARRATDHIELLRQQFPEVAASWNRDGTFHLTLKFIGAMPCLLVERLSQAAARAANKLSSFNLILQDSGVFPGRGTPRVLWLGIDDSSGKLAHLRDQLDEECAMEGFAKDDRSFHPHLTLARLRKPPGLRALAAAHKEIGFEAIEFQVSELLVIRSELSSLGSKYSVISSHPLKGSCPNL